MKSSIAEMNQDNVKWMTLALEEAKIAFEQNEVPVGAVVVRDGKLIARCHNMREQSNDSTAHAEMLAIREASEQSGTWRLEGCTMYVTLEPCPMCAGAMIMSRLSRCVYGAYDENQGCCGSVYDFAGDSVFHSNMQWQSGCMENECRKLLTDFFAKKRKKDN